MRLIPVGCIFFCFKLCGQVLNLCGDDGFSRLDALAVSCPDLWGMSPGAMAASLTGCGKERRSRVNRGTDIGVLEKSTRALKTIIAQDCLVVGSRKLPDEFQLHANGKEGGLARDR